MRFDDFVSSLTLAVHRGSRVMLDNLGITISMRLLESWPAYALARKAMFGTHWLSRLWCRKLRPVLKPQRQAIIKAEFEKQQKIIQQEYLLAVLEAGVERAKELKRDAK